jgi:uncharacterized membrane protein YphA (DoxX/SURF4 family)
MDAFSLVARVLLAVLFAVAAVGKTLDRRGSEEAAGGFGVPAALAPPAVVGVVICESLVSFGLLVSATATWAAALSLALLALFTVAIARVVRRGDDVTCNCFGQLQSASVGWPTLVRNLLLAAAAALVVVVGPGTSLAAVELDRLALLATSIGVIGLAAVVWRLRLDNGRLQALVDAPASRVGLPVGADLPDVELRDLDGAPVALGSRVGRGMPALLVQVGLNCAPCHALMPELVRWTDALADTLAVVIISAGEQEPNRVFADRFGVPGLLVDRDHRLPAAVGIVPTPSAFVVDGHGRAAGAPAMGAPAIEALLRGTLDAHRERRALSAP